MHFAVPAHLPDAMLLEGFSGCHCLQTTAACIRQLPAFWQAAFQHAVICMCIWQLGQLEIFSQLCLLTA